MPQLRTVIYLAGDEGSAKTTMAANFRNRVANLGNDLGPVGTSMMNPDIDMRPAANATSTR
jgi:hypothetical protein